MTFHESWENWSIAANDKMVDLCKAGDLQVIYDFDQAISAFDEEVKETFGIKLLNYWDGSFEGHEEPQFPKEYYAFSECQEVNKRLSAMKGRDICSDLQAVWLNEMDVTATTSDGQTVNLHDCDLPLGQIVSVHIGVLAQREHTDPYFYEQ